VLASFRHGREAGAVFLRHWITARASRRQDAMNQKKAGANRLFL
jgi:hypothetical protein